MGLLGDLMENTAFMLGEVKRMERTRKNEIKNMTPKLQQTIDNLTKRAETGDIEAMTSLAEAYYNGTQLRYDPAEACKWWTMAAEAGDVNSMYNLGLLYTGDISKQVYNDKLASYWLYEASKHGNRNAERVLYEKYTYSHILKKWKRRWE